MNIDPQLRALLAVNLPADEIQDLTYKHLSLQAQEKLAGMTCPPRDSDLKGEDRIAAQIEGMRFHAKVNAALRVIAADALIAALNAPAK